VSRFFWIEQKATNGNILFFVGSCTFLSAQSRTLSRLVFDEGGRLICGRKMTSVLIGEPGKDEQKQTVGQNAELAAPDETV
jgi:hypothetical protein